MNEKVEEKSSTSGQCAVTSLISGVMSSCP